MVTGAMDLLSAEKQHFVLIEMERRFTKLVHDLDGLLFLVEMLLLLLYRHLEYFISESHERGTEEKSRDVERLRHDAQSLLLLHLELRDMC